MIKEREEQVCEIFKKNNFLFCFVLAFQRHLFVWNFLFDNFVMRKKHLCGIFFPRIKWFDKIEIFLIFSLVMLRSQILGHMSQVFKSYLSAFFHLPVYIINHMNEKITGIWYLCIVPFGHLNFWNITIKWVRIIC